MSANKTSQSHLESRLEQVRADREVATERLFRLFRETFEDGDRAIRGYGNLVANQGIEVAVRKLEQDDGFRGRNWHFGWMRGGMLALGNRQKAVECLRELPDAMREHYSLVGDERDLERALEKSRERNGERREPDRDPFWKEPDRERER